MNTQAIQPQAIVDIPVTRLTYWSVRRELWEHPSIYIAPLGSGAVYLVGYMIFLVQFPRSMRHAATLDAAHERIELAMPYAHAGMLVALAALLAGIFYSLDALHSERSERSILFWKSLPVSDLITVLSKACIPLVVLPALTFAISIALHIALQLLGSAVLMASGTSAAILWTQLPFFEMKVELLYSVIVVALWHAPIYGWMLLVSAWARRAAFLWAVLPPLALCAIERIAFNTTHLATLLLSNRFLGFTNIAYDLTDKAGAPVDAHYIPLERLVPGRFLTSPGLWLGLLFAAICLAAAVHLRRSRDPI